MFILKYQGSILKVEQASEINITTDGVKVTLLGETTPKIKNPKLEQIASDIGKKIMGQMDLPMRGPKKDPNSTQQRVFATCSKLLSEGFEPSEIRREVLERFPGRNQGSLNGYFYTWKRENRPIV